MNSPPQQPSQPLADIVRGLDPWHLRRLTEIGITTGDDGGWLAGLTFLRDIPSREDERPPHDSHPVHTYVVPHRLTLPSSETETALAAQTRALQDSGLVGQLRLRRVRPWAIWAGTPPPPGFPRWTITTHAGSRVERSQWLASLGVNPRSRPDT